jgi:hypothetical protein
MLLQRTCRRFSRQQGVLQIRFTSSRFAMRSKQIECKINISKLLINLWDVPSMHIWHQHSVLTQLQDRLGDHFSLNEYYPWVAISTILDNSDIPFIYYVLCGHISTANEWLDDLCKTFLTFFDKKSLWLVGFAFVDVINDVYVTKITKSSEINIHFAIVNGYRDKSSWRRLKMWEKRARLLTLPPMKT